MKRKIIAVISGAVILIIAAGSIYGKPESGHKEGETDVVGTFSINRCSYQDSSHIPCLWRILSNEKNSPCTSAKVLLQTLLYPQYFPG